MKALVTGTSGFVGRYLAARLAGSGAEVLGLDAAAPGSDGISASFEVGGQVLPPLFPREHLRLVQCDLLDAGAVEDAVSSFGPDVIFHLAAQSSAARSFKDPAGTMRVNVMGTLNLLESARRSGRARILLAGSAEEYGRRPPEDMPLSEEAPVEPVSPYASSKVAQNTIAMQYHRAFGMEVVATRSFNHTGPGQTTAFVLPSFARQCAEIKLDLREPVLRTGNLDVTRDFLDVRDVVEAYMMLADKGEPGSTYNVCSGEGLAISSALRTLAGMTGRDVSIETDPDLLRPADVPVLTGDNRKLAERCGWSAATGKDRMLEDLFKWWEASAAAAMAAGTTERGERNA